jgi:hypothetical protein
MQVFEDPEPDPGIGEEVYDADPLASSRPPSIAILGNLVGKANFT